MTIIVLTEDLGVRKTIDLIRVATSLKERGVKVADIVFIDENQ